MSDYEEKLAMDYYHHIDNGGIIAKITKTFDKKYGEYVGSYLDMYASFYGYTEHNFRINNVNSKFLEELGTRLIAAAKELKKTEEGR